MTRSTWGVDEPSVRVDCHVHTTASGDSVCTVEQLAQRAQECGIDAVFITDHHQVSAALDAQQCRGLGVRILVGEEIRTPDGEIIALFLTERIPYVLPVDEVVERVHEQGGLVCLPHPYDPDRHGVGASADRLCASGHVDVVEVFNAKTRGPEYNHAALRLARRYNLPGCAGSDAHDQQGVGAAFVDMPGFDSPQGFLAGLRKGRIIGEYRPHARRYVEDIAQSRNSGRNR